MLTEEIKKYLKEHKGKLTPLEFFALVDSSPQIEQILLEKNNATYKIITDDGLTRKVKIVKTLKKDS